MMSRLEGSAQRSSTKAARQTESAPQCQLARVQKERSGENEVPGRAEGRIPGRELRRDEIRAMQEVPDRMEHEPDPDQRGSPPETEKREHKKRRSNQPL